METILIRCSSCRKPGTEKQIGKRCDREDEHEFRCCLGEFEKTIINIERISVMQGTWIEVRVPKDADDEAKSIILSSAREAFLAKYRGCSPGTRINSVRGMTIKDAEKISTSASIARKRYEDTLAEALINTTEDMKKLIIEIHKEREITKCDETDEKIIDRFGGIF